MQELKFWAINLAIRSLFNLVILVRISSCWQDFLMSRLLIIFSTSFPLVFLKWKVIISWEYIICFRNIFLNLDLFFIALWSSFDMKKASLARMYFFIGAWQLIILKIVLLYIPKLSTLELAVTISYLNLHYWKFWNPILILVTVKRWKSGKSERPVSKALLYWNRLGQFVSIRSIHCGPQGFWKKVFETCWFFD